MLQRVYRATDLVAQPQPQPVSVGARHGLLVLNWSPWWLSVGLGPLQLQLVPGWHSARLQVPATSRMVILAPYQIETGAVQSLDVPSAPHGVWVDADMLVEREEITALSGVGAPVSLIGPDGKRLASTTDNPDGSELLLSIQTLAAGAVTDGSGTITNGGTAQQVFAANAARRYLLIQNQSTGDLWVNYKGSAAVESQPSVLLAPNGSLSFDDSFVPNAAVSLIGATTGQAFVAEQG